MNDAERWLLEARLKRLEAERSRARLSCGGPLPDVATLDRHAAYTAGLDEEIAEIREKLPHAPLPPPESTLHHRPPLERGWTRDTEEEAGNAVDYDPFSRSPTARRE